MMVPPWIRWWLFGALTGIGLLSVMGLLFSPITPLLLTIVVLVLLVVLVTRSPERAAFGGGALVPTGLWYLYTLRAAVERCAEIDRSATGSCSIYGVEEQAIAMGLYLLVGVSLTAYAAVRQRLTRA